MKRIIAITIAILLASAGYSSATENTSVINVKTRVLPVMKYSILYQESNLTITQEDINKGFIDVQEAVVLSVKTNSTNGYLLAFSLESNMFSRVTVRNENNVYNLSETGGEIHMPFHGMNVTTQKLSIRFHLLSNISPGQYEWPVSVLISAI